MKRREYLKNTSLALAAATFSKSALAVPAARQSRSPKKNILLIMTDQWRGDWMPGPDMPHLDLPILQQFMNESAQFNNCICNSPQCAPSRVSFTSGLYAGRTGSYLNNYCVYPTEETLVYPENKDGFKEDNPSMYKRLRDQGYRTATVGKHDLLKGSTLRSDKVYESLGFTDWVDHKAYKGSYLKTFFSDKPELYATVQKDWKMRMDKKSPAQVAPFALDDYYFYDNVVGRQAVAFLDTFHEEDPEQPWMLTVNFHAPHPPWDAPKRYLEKELGKTFPESIPADGTGKPAGVTRASKRHEPSMKYIDQIKAHYAAKMKLLDDWLGELRKTLQENGEAENTMIIFASDHGEMMGDFGLFSKQQMYEASLRVPMVVHTPGQTKVQQSDALVELVDIYPTVMDYAGVATNNKRLDGKSLLPLVAGKTKQHKEYQFSEFNTLDKPPYATTRMVADHRYKLINNHGFQELYDLENDPRELKNVATENLELVEQLQAKMDEFSASSLPPQRVAKPKG